MSTSGNVEAREVLIGKIMIPDVIYGKSAYEIAVMHGFRGTEEEWLASLQGESISKAEMIEAVKASIEDVELYDGTETSANKGISDLGQPTGIEGYILTQMIPVDVGASGDVVIRIRGIVNNERDVIPFYTKVAYYDKDGGIIDFMNIRSSYQKHEYAGGILRLYVGYAADGTRFARYSDIAYVRVEVKAADSYLSSANGFITSIQLEKNEAKDYVLLRSSTEGSEKVFKLTVNDAAQISVTEV